VTCYKQSHGTFFVPTDGFSTTWTINEHKVLHRRRVKFQNDPKSQIWARDDIEAFCQMFYQTWSTEYTPTVATVKVARSGTNTDDVMLPVYVRSRSHRLHNHWPLSGYNNYLLVRSYSLFRIRMKSVGLVISAVRCLQTGFVAAAVKGALHGILFCTCRWMNPRYPEAGRIAICYEMLFPCFATICRHSF
jgi:hypothetical protein